VGIAWVSKVTLNFPSFLGANARFACLPVCLSKNRMR
jgi:hypothetical protein